MFDKRKDGKQGSSPDYQPNNSQNQSNDTVSAATPAAGTGHSTAVIGPGIKVNGDISGDENLVIKGQVEGKVNLGANRVEVDQSGRVNADITAKEVQISGQLIGDINGNEKVVISKVGKVCGNVVAPRVILEDGAKFKGSIDMDTGEAAATELPLPKSKPHAADNVKAIKKDKGRDTAQGDLAAKGG